MKLEYERSFLKDLKSIKDTNLKQRIEEAIIELKAADKIESIASVIKMKGHESAYRQRIGDYRAGFYLLIKNEEKVIRLVRLLHRNKIYNYFPR